MSVFNAFGAVESYHIDLNAEGILPTKQELDDLSERVEALSREVDALAKQRKQD
jgi:polyhydroxyalkanoate synthesis regulator phasin